MDQEFARHNISYMSAGLTRGPPCFVRDSVPGPACEPIFRPPLTLSFEARALLLVPAGPPRAVASVSGRRNGTKRSSGNGRDNQYLPIHMTPPSPTFCGLKDAKRTARSGWWSEVDRHVANNFPATQTDEKRQKSLSGPGTRVTVCSRLPPAVYSLQPTAFLARAPKEGAKRCRKVQKSAKLELHRRGHIRESLAIEG